MTPAARPPPVEPPQPEQGKSVVAGKVSGTIRIRLKNGKFRTLGAERGDPAREHDRRHQGPRAADLGGRRREDPDRRLLPGRSSRSRRPRARSRSRSSTLTGKLSCGGKASAAAKKKKKVRRLWGDGKGRSAPRAAVQRGDRARHQVAHRGHVHQHDDHGQARRRSTVRDFVKRKNVTVKKGHSYVARKKRK